MKKTRKVKRFENKFCISPPFDYTSFIHFLICHILFIFLATFLILLDQWSKYFFVHFLRDASIKVFWDYVVLRVVHNTGIAFSLPIEGIILKALTIVLIVIIGVYFLKYEKLRNNIYTQVAYACILSGAIGNGIERVYFGAVTDFIAIKYFAILNFADIFISVWVILLSIIYFSHERNSRK